MILLQNQSLNKQFNIIHIRTDKFAKQIPSKYLYSMVKKKTLKIKRVEFVSTANKFENFVLGIRPKSGSIGYSIQ